MPARHATMHRRSTMQSRQGRFSRPMPTQRPAQRAHRGGKKQHSGLSGMLGSAMSSLPMGGGSKRRRGKKGSSSKAGPAVGLLMAGAGALLGRRQMMKKRREDETPDMSTPAM